VALEVSLQIGKDEKRHQSRRKYKANIYEDGDILSSLQRLDLEDLCSKISLDRELDPKSEQSLGNEVLIIALMSRKFLKALVLEDMSLP
jgi:hypothetical protein